MMSYIECEIPDGFLCPITQEVMLDPVVAADGQSYQRESITEWLRRGKRKSPLNGSNLSSTILYDNVALRNVIRDFVEKRPYAIGGIKSDLDLCIKEREETIKNLIEKIEEIKGYSNDVIINQTKEIENRDVIIKHHEREISDLKEEF